MNAPANPRRFRECPECFEVFAASMFRVRGSYYGGRDGEAKRRCPGCGYVAVTSEFPVVPEGETR